MLRTATRSPQTRGFCSVRPARRSSCFADGHQQPDLFALRLGRIERPDEATAVHHDDTIRQLEDLVEIRRDQQHANARIALRNNLTMNELDAPDIETTSRLIKDQKFQVVT